MTLLKLIACTFCFFMFTYVVSAQKPTTKPPEAPVKTPDPYLVRWRVYIDTLAQEAKSVPDERRPYVVADVAAAYWQIDRAETERLLVQALDEAWRLSQEDKKKFGGMIRYVVAVGARTDVSLAKMLTKRLAEKPGANPGVEKWSDAALEMAADDPKAAAELAESLAPNGGGSYGVMKLIFELVKTDPALASRVYSTFVRKAVADPSFPLEDLQGMSSFAFGYPGYMSFVSGGTTGFPLFPKPAGYSADPANGKLLLDAALRRIPKAIELRNNTAADDLLAKNFQLLAIIAYMRYEVERYAPETAAAWTGIEEQARLGVAPDITTRVDEMIAGMAKERQILADAAEKPSAVDDINDQVLLARAENVAGTCERDLIYARVVTNFGFNKNFKRGQEMLDKMKTDWVAEPARTQLYFDMASDNIANRDLDSAEARAKKIPYPEMRALIQIRLVPLIYAKGDKIHGTELVSSASATIEKATELTDRIGLYFGLASALVSSDPIEARAIFEKAVKTLNKAEPKNEFRYQYFLKLANDCTDQKSGMGYWRSVSQLENSTVMQAVVRFARESPDATEPLTDLIADKPTRIRSQALLAKTALAKYRSR